MKRIVLVATAIFMSLIFLLSFPAKAPAQSFLNNACNVANTSVQNSVTCHTFKTGGKTNPATDVIQKATNLIAVIGGIAGVIMIIVAGFRYATAGGNEEQAKAARTTIINTVIGLIIIALAWVIVSFVIQKVIK